MSPKQWCASASPGERLVYHSSCSLALVGGGPVIQDVRDLYDEGLIDLVQKRGSYGKFDYIAVKRRTRAKIPLEHSFKFMEEMRY